MTRFVLIAGSLLAAAAVAFSVAGRTAPTPRRPAPGLRGDHLPAALEGRTAFAFDLADARGGRVSARALRGRPYAITFLFTTCPDVCPVIGQQLRGTLASLGSQASKVAIVAVSVDPKGDTRAAVNRWLRRQRMPPNFHFAIGTEDQLDPSWAAYFAVPRLAGRPDTASHAGAVWLVDREGRLRARYTSNELEPADVAADLRTLLRERRTAGR